MLYIYNYILGNKQFIILTHNLYIHTLLSCFFFSQLNVRLVHESQSFQETLNTERKHYDKNLSKDIHMNLKRYVFSFSFSFFFPFFSFPNFSFHLISYYFYIDIIILCLQYFLFDLYIYIYIYVLLGKIYLQSGPKSGRRLVFYILI